MCQVNLFNQHSKKYYIAQALFFCFTFKKTANVKDTTKAKYIYFFIIFTLNKSCSPSPKTMMRTNINYQVSTTKVIFVVYNGVMVQHPSL